MKFVFHDKEAIPEVVRAICKKVHQFAEYVGKDRDSSFSRFRDRQCQIMKCDNKTLLRQSREIIKLVKAMTTNRKTLSDELRAHYDNAEAMVANHLRFFIVAPKVRCGWLPCLIVCALTYIPEEANRRVI
jgi:hypothetical protein